MRRVLSFLLGGLALGSSGPASAANALDLFGFGPRGAAMAGALTADAEGYAAVHYNPAMLVRSRELNFGFNLQWARLTPSVERLSGQSQPLNCSACTPPDAAGLSTGFVFPLAGKVHNKVALGVGMYLPSGRILRLRAADPDQPHWYHYNNGPDGLVLDFGAGVHVTERLKLGVGAQVLANLVGTGADVRIDLFSKRIDSREVDSQLVTRAAPVASLFYAPSESLRFGFAYRGELSIRYVIPAKLDLDGVGQLDLQLSGITHFQPHTFRMGAGYDVSPTLTLTAEGAYALWSRAPSPYLDLDVDVSGETLEGLGLGEALDLQSSQQPPGFKDTLSVAMGAELHVSERFDARGGAYFRPTPVPLQDAAQTNILDGSTVGFSAGVGSAFDDPLEIFSAPIHLDLATQCGFVLRREATKQPTDEVPAYGYSGRLLSLTVAVSYSF